MASSTFISGCKIKMQELSFGCRGTAAKILYQIKELHCNFPNVANVVIDPGYINRLRDVLSEVINYESKNSANYRELLDHERKSFKRDLAEALFKESKEHNNAFIQAGDSSYLEKPLGLVLTKGICYNENWEWSTERASSNDGHNSSYDGIKKTKYKIVFPEDLFATLPLKGFITNFILNSPYQKIMNQNFYWANSNSSDKAIILYTYLKQVAESKDQIAKTNIKNAFTLFGLPGLSGLITSFLPDERPALPSARSKIG